jgi:dTDP-4-dehydrorhamnose 3,5-epimerase
MKIIPTELAGLVMVEPQVHTDLRGYLVEHWKHSSYAAAGIPELPLQDNLSYSTKGVLRGLHFQHPVGQAKLVSVLAGEIYDVAVDVRVGSATFARWFATRLSCDNRRQLFIPVGFAHGFCVVSDSALVSYKCSQEYQPELARTILWCDPRLAIPWPVANPTLSEKDACAVTLAEQSVDALPAFEARGN